MGRMRKKRSFLLQSGARTLDLRKISAMSEKEVYEKFKYLRWKGGIPVCPKCGCDATYERRTRKQWRCKLCGHVFSLTSGTLFHAHKLSLRDYLMAVLIFVNAAKGESALQVGRDLGLQHRSAFVLERFTLEMIHIHSS